MADAASQQPVANPSPSAQAASSVPSGSGTPGVSPPPEGAQATANNPFTRAAPGGADNSNNPPRNRGGRPRGSKDKPNSPRARRRAAQAPSAAANNAAPDNEARSPFEGEVAGEKEQRERAKSRPHNSERARKARNVMDMFPLDQVADNVIDMGNMLIVGVASKRYGSAAQHLAYGPEEKAFLSPLMVEVLKDLDIQLTPGEALGLVAVFLLSQKVALLEIDLAARRNGERPPPPSQETVTMNAQDAISKEVA